ncbi:MAG: hypothetical protein Q8L39_04235 [Burkholderiales bacterium]|nr:hypothetical protein [Burkholderiales bacterium]
MNKLTIEQQKNEAGNIVAARALSLEACRAELESNLVSGGDDLLDELERAVTAAQSLYARAVARLAGLETQLTDAEARAKLDIANAYRVKGDALRDELQAKLNAFEKHCAPLASMALEIGMVNSAMFREYLAAKQNGSNPGYINLSVPGIDASVLALRQVARTNDHTFKG